MDAMVVILRRYRDKSEDSDSLSSDDEWEAILCEKKSVNFAREFRITSLLWTVTRDSNSKVILG